MLESMLAHFLRAVNFQCNPFNSHQISCADLKKLMGSPLVSKFEEAKE